MNDLKLYAKNVKGLQITTERFSDARDAVYFGQMCESHIKEKFATKV